MSCSDTEGLSNSVIEAMAVGKPVIATAVGGTLEIVEEGRGGFLYAPRDVATLTERIALLAADPGLRHRMGRIGERFAAERLSVSALLAQHERLYRELAPAPSAPVVGGDGAPL